MRILVTGASGFIGRHLTNRLISLGHEVTAVASSECDFPGVYKIVHPGLMGIDPTHVYRQEAIFHLAADNDTLSTDSAAMCKANVSDSVQLLCLAARGCCTKFIYASSTAVYGNSPPPYDEATTPTDPLNDYAKTKLTFDGVATMFAMRHSLMTVVGLRYCNVYGPGEQHKGRRMSMIGQMIQKAVSGHPIKLFKDGNQKRDWVFIDDVVDANCLALRSSESEIYNIGYGQAVTFNQLAHFIMDRHNNFGDLPPLEYIENPHPESYQVHTECKIEKARTQLGYEPQYDYQKGIREYIRRC